MNPPIHPLAVVLCAPPELEDTLAVLDSFFQVTGVSETEEKVCMKHNKKDDNEGAWELE